MLNRKFKWFTAVTLVLYLVSLLLWFEKPYGSTIFKDVTKDHWARFDIEYMFNNGLMKGRDESVWNFYPYAEMTRAELVALMLKVDKVDLTKLPKPDKSKYTDVPQNHWVVPVLAEAEKRKLIPFQDVTADKFQPDKPITRGELAQAVVESLHIPINTAGGQDLTDIKGNPYEAAIRTVVAEKFAKGNTDGTFKPDEQAKREQVASLFAQALKKLHPTDKDKTDKKGGDE